jgi:hypothetical protein
MRGSRGNRPLVAAGVLRKIRGYSQALRVGRVKFQKNVIVYRFSHGNKPGWLHRHPDVSDGWLASTRWSNSYLRETVGDARVLVEERSSTKDKFGQLNEVAMQFAAFMDLVEAGDPLHYLTTQVCRLWVPAIASFRVFLLNLLLEGCENGRGGAAVNHCAACDATVV